MVDPLEHQGLVRSVASRYTRKGKASGLTFEDLVAEGQLGLLHAVKRFDPSRGAFSTIAVLMIRQRISRYIDRQRTVAIPHNVLGAIKRSEHDKRTKAALHLKGGPIPIQDLVSEHQPLDHRQDRTHTLIETEALHALLGCLSLAEQRVIRLRYGLDDGIFRTHEEVGAEVGRTTRMAKHIHRTAIELMREEHRRRSA